MHDLTLSTQQLDIIMSALAELPWRYAHPVISEIQRQTSGAPSTAQAPPHADGESANG